MLATEDRRFYDHFGIDVTGTLRALIDQRAAGGVVQGGSTITQQLAKNLFLSNERTLDRKIKEAFLALWLEARLTKNEILKLYLDRAYMGGGTFGVDAAAQYYFNKSARDVDLAEAAMLAGLFKAPTKYSPNVNLPAARARANVVLDNLVEAGFMTEGQVFGARRHPATPVDRSDEQAPNYYLDWAFDQVKKLVDTFPKSMTERVFVVRTALDPNLQTRADAGGREFAAPIRPGISRQPGGDGADGHRRRGARHGRRARLRRQPVQPRHRRACASPAPRSSPMSMPPRCEHGLKPTSIVVDAPICLGNWCPHNYGRRYRGAHDADHGAHALDQHHCRAAVGDARRRQRQARPRQDHQDRARHGHHHAAARHAVAADRRRRRELIEHVGAYATFPNLGMTVDAARHPRSAHRQRQTDLALRPRRPEAASGCCRSTSRSDMIMMMNSVVENGTGRRARLDGIAASGKTGTTNAYRDAWFMGYTGNFVCGVWFGNDNYDPTNRMTGGSLPAMTWHDIMTYAHQGIEIKPLPGVPAPPERQQPRGCAKVQDRRAAAAAASGHADQARRRHPGQIEQMMDEANRCACGPRPPTAATEQEQQAAKSGDALASALEGRAFERN